MSFKKEVSTSILCTVSKLSHAVHCFYNVFHFAVFHGYFKYLKNNLEQLNFHQKCKINSIQCQLINFSELNCRNWVFLKTTVCGFYSKSSLKIIHKILNIAFFTDYTVLQIYFLDD